MKKVLSVLLSFAIIATMTTFTSFSAFAAVTIGDFTVNCTGSTATNRAAEVQVYTGTATDVTVPASFTYNGNEYPVKTFKETLFQNNTNITSVTFESELVTQLRTNAFKGCSNLASVTIPGAKQYGMSCFAGTALETFNFPDDVTFTSLGTSMFQDCTKLESVTGLDNGTVKSLPASIFKGCSSLESIVVPDKYTGVGANAFEDCTALESVVFPASITSLQSKVFSGCSSLTSVTLPGIKTYGTYCFAGTALETFSFPAGVTYTSLGANMFQDCTNLESVTGLDNGTVNTLPVNIFKGCSSLESVVVPDKYTGVGASAFEDCTSLVSVSLPAISTIEESIFKNCTSLESFVIPSTVKTIKKDAFCNTAIKELELPSSVTTVNSPFSNMNSLEKITLSYVTNIKAFTSLFGGTIPASLTTVGMQSGEISDGLLKDLSQITSVELGDSVTAIGKEAFSGCSITSIKIPASATVLTDSLVGLDNLEEVIIANASNVASFNDMFDNNVPASVTTVTLESGNVQANAFSGSSTLNKVILSSDVYYVSQNAFKDCTNLAVLIVYGESTGIYNDADTVSNSGSDFSGTIYSYTGSSAEYYAEKNGKNYDDIRCMNGHTWVATVVPATCGSQGYTVHTCQICGKSYVDSYTPITSNHDYGSNLKYCTICNTKNPNYIDTSAQGTSNTSTSTSTSAASKKPAATKVGRVLSKKKAFKVGWTKKSGVTGYQIQYSTSKKFTSKTTKTVTVKGAKNSAKTISKLKAKKKYYVRVRTYKTSKAKRTYSSWSSYKTVTTKK